jgi:hypothetical protein
MRSIARNFLLFRLSKRVILIFRDVIKKAFRVREGFAFLLLYRQFPPKSGYSEAAGAVRNGTNALIYRGLA